MKCCRFRFLRQTRGLILAFVGCSNAFAYVAIYNGPGAANAPRYKEALKNVLPIDTEFKNIGPRSIITGSFAEGCDLLVMPGGADKPYCKELNGTGNHNIRSYVEQGGRYLGTCAGAYYGATNLLFDEQSSNPMAESRELSFFKGRARGPLFVPYPQGGSYGAQIALSSYGQDKDDPRQDVTDTCFIAYYYGGPFFEPTISDDGICKVLAYYLIPEALEKKLYLKPDDEAYWSREQRILAAILSINVGEGHVILTGVHLENTKYDKFNKGKSWGRKNMLKRCLQEMGLAMREDI